MTADIEEEIALLRAELVRVKESLAGAFGHPAEFTALGDALRAGSAKLARLEAELRDAQLEARDEPWWRNPSRRANGKVLALPKSATAFRSSGRR